MPILPSPPMNFTTLHDSPVGLLLSRLLSLLVVFLLLAATAVWTGRLLGRDILPSTCTTATLPSTPDAAVLQALQLNSSTTRLVARDSASWTVTDIVRQNEQGIILYSLPYARNVNGFGGPTPVYIYIGPSGTIDAMAVGPNAETPDFMKRSSEGTLRHWKGLTPNAGANLKVDAVSGATFTSKALIAHMQAALQAYSASNHTAQSEPAIGWTRTLAVAAVLLLGIFVSRRYKGNRHMRLLVLALNVGVTGFWCGQFLSLTLLRGWIANGFDPIIYLPTVLMLGVALVLPLLGNKRHHCNWSCPFGSLQELAWRIPLPKIHCSARTFRLMGHIRMGILSVLLLLLWTGTGAFLLDYEPFSAFLLSTAPPAVIALAGSFVVASCFVPNLWCKACCPIGALLDLTEQ